jgi:hypothetical protein
MTGFSEKHLVEDYIIEQLKEDQMDDFVTGRKRVKPGGEI